MMGKKMWNKDVAKGTGENLYAGGNKGKAQMETNEAPGKRGMGGATGYGYKCHDNMVPGKKFGNHGPE